MKMKVKSRMVRSENKSKNGRGYGRFFYLQMYFSRMGAEFVSPMRSLIFCVDIFEVCGFVYYDKSIAICQALDYHAA